MTTIIQAVETRTYKDYVLMSKITHIRIIRKYAAPKGARVPEKRDNYEQAIH